VFPRWRLILRYLPPHRRDIAVGMVALVVSNAAMVAGPDLLARGFEAVPLQSGGAVDTWC
jgi:hypothetical protein